MILAFVVPCIAQVSFNSLLRVTITWLSSTLTLMFSLTSNDNSPFCPFTVTLFSSTVTVTELGVVIFLLSILLKANHLVSIIIAILMRIKQKTKNVLFIRVSRFCLW